jgi:hypothetical protein
VLAFGAGCDGGGDDDDGGGDVTASATAAPTERAGERESPVPTLDPSGRATSTPAPALGLRSFRYTSEFSIEADAPGDAPPDSVRGRVDGTFVAPDLHAWTQTGSVGDISVREEWVFLPDAAWRRDGGAGAWEQLSRGEGEALANADLTSLDRDFLALDEDFVESLSALQAQADTVDGRTARYYVLTQNDIDTISRLLGPDAFGGAPIDEIRDLEFRIWLDDETGALLRADFSATAPPEALGDEPPFAVAPGSVLRLRLTVALRDVNSDAVTVEPPA